jgi:hypothetical protein
MIDGNDGAACIIRRQALVQNKIVIDGHIIGFHGNRVVRFFRDGLGKTIQDRQGIDGMYSMGQIFVGRGYSMVSGHDDDKRATIK